MLPSPCDAYAWDCVWLSRRVSHLALGLWAIAPQLHLFCLRFWGHSSTESSLSSLVGRFFGSLTFCNVRYLSRWTRSLQLSRGSHVVSPSSHLTLNQSSL